MTFKEATDQLMARGISLREIGESLGVAHTTVRAARLDPQTSSYRSAPEGWRPKLADLAHSRGQELQDLAVELREPLDLSGDISGLAKRLAAEG